jgi:hypothetical protein
MSVLSARLRALDHARSYLGVKERGGYNRGPLIDRWNLDAGVPVGSAWCMSFVRAMYARAGVKLGGGASVGNFESWAKAHGNLVTRPFRGDVVCFDWNGDRWADHVGIVERVLALRWKGRVFVGWIQTIEGNTSSGARGSQDNGDGVYRRRRWATACKFARIN